MLEVELKAVLEGIDQEQIEARREALGFVPDRELREVDVYFNGVDRDFRETDEALRLRSCTGLSDGTGACYMTYKGPKLDGVSNTRTEYEVAVSDLQTAEKLLSALGCRAVYTVDKVRREFRLNEVTLCLDTVAGLGRFLELEQLVPEGGRRETAEAELLGLLERLEVPRDRLTGCSYLELLIEKNTAE